MPVEFSTIIPTYRRPAQLLEAVTSVLAQVKATVEIIVVDDCPESSARAVIDRLNDPRVTYLKIRTRQEEFPALFEIWLGGMRRECLSIFSTTTTLCHKGTMLRLEEFTLSV